MNWASAVVAALMVTGTSMMIASRGDKPLALAGALIITIAVGITFQCIKKAGGR